MERKSHNTYAGDDAWQFHLNRAPVYVSCVFATDGFLLHEVPVGYSQCLRGSCEETDRAHKNREKDRHDIQSRKRIIMLCIYFYEFLADTVAAVFTCC